MELLKGSLIQHQLRGNQKLYLKETSLILNYGVGLNFSQKI